MNQEQKSNMRMLVSDLRSTSKPQVRGQLLAINNGRSFCCLGRACERSQLGKWGIRGDYLEYKVSTIKFNSESEHSYMPEAVADFYGFQGKDPMVPGLFPRKWKEDDVLVLFDNGLDVEHELRLAEGIITMTELNDDCKLTFPQIADVIEYFWQLKD